MEQGVLARRAAGLSTAFPAPHFPSELDPGVIAFDSGFASPRLLPELMYLAVLPYFGAEAAAAEMRADAV